MQSKTDGAQINQITDADIQMNSTDVQIIETNVVIDKMNINLQDVGKQVNEKTCSVQISSLFERHVQINSNGNKSTEIGNLKRNEDDDLVLIEDENDNDINHTKINARNEKIDEKHDNVKENNDQVPIEDQNSNLNNKNTSSYNTNENFQSSENCNVENADLDIDLILIEYDNSNKDNTTGTKLNNNSFNVVPSVSTEAADLEEDIKRKKIDFLEEQIKNLNSKILELETSEVDWDNDTTSPYLLSENYKTLLVKLYKELCETAGSVSVKRREVRLKVLEGHPEGPVRCLESFINSNIDENGNPPFPDMRDVIDCVEEANKMYQLHWSRRDIEKEARALFIHYGRTVQKKRQKREWRHLMRYVQKEQISDPADEDPTLQARLQENFKLAIKNEKDIIDKYAQMDNTGVMRNDVAELNAKPSQIYRRIPLTYNVPSSANIPNLIGPQNENMPMNDDLQLKNNAIGTDNVVFFNACTSSNENLVLRPALVTYPLTIAVNENIMNVIRFTATADNVVTEASQYINSNIDGTVTQENTCERRERVELEVNTKPNLNTGDAIVEVNEQTTHLGAKSHEIKEENKDDSENCDATVENNELITDFGSNSNVIKQENIVNTDLNIDVDVKPNINEIEVTQPISIQDNEVSTNSDENVRPETNVTENGEVSSSSEVCRNEELEHVAGTSNTDETIVKTEPLDIPRMLEELGDNYTVSIIDIEDPFQIIEISDSSDSEDDDDECWTFSRTF